MATTTNTALTTTYAKIIDAADVDWKVSLSGGECEFVYSAEAPAAGLDGHVLRDRDGISYDVWGAGNVYFRKFEGTSSAVIVTK